MKQHVMDMDSVCKRCHMTIRARIPHECDPTICRKCDGFGGSWQSKQGGWVECENCEGSGRQEFK